MQLDPLSGYLQAAFEEAPLPMQIYDANGVHLASNRACLQLFGISDPAALSGFNFIHEHHLTEDARRRVMAGETIRVEVDIDFDHLQAPGGPVPMTGKASIEIIANRMQGIIPPGYMVIMRDISTRKRTQAELAESTRLMHQGFQANPAASVITHPATGVVMEVNTAWQETIGYSREEVLGRSVFDLGIFLDLHETDAIHASLEAGEEVRNRQMQLRHRNGDIITVAYSAEVITYLGETFFFFAFINVTEFASARAELQKALEHLDLAMNAARLTWWEWDLTTQTLNFDKNMAAPYTVPADIPDNYQYSLQTVLEYLHPDDLPGLVDIMQRRSSGEMTIAEVTHRVRRIDGTWAWVLSRGEVIHRDPDGLPTHLAGFSMDITPQKEAETELQRQRDFARQVMDALGQGLAISGPGSIYEYANPALCSMLGYELDEIIGKSPRGFVNPDDLPRLDQAWEARQQGVSSAYELRMLRKDGSLLPVLVSGTPRWQDGRITGAIVVITDLSWQKQLEEALRASELRYRTIADNTFNWEFWISPDGIPIYTSPSCERITGYTPAQIMGDHHLIINMIHPDDRPFIQNHMASLPHPEDMTHFLEYRIFTAWNEERWIEHTCRPIFSDGGEYLGRRGTNHDITARKHAEARLLHMSTHDALTGAYNRSYFDAEMERLAAGRRFPVSIVMVDVDGLKHTNDTQGHAAGDQLLARTANLLQRIFRQEDITARIGGDEFAILLPETDPAACAARVVELRQTLARAAGMDPAAALSLSIGSSVALAPSELHAAQIAADRAMYADKARRKH